MKLLTFFTLLGLLLTASDSAAQNYVQDSLAVQKVAKKAFKKLQTTPSEGILLMEKAAQLAREKGLYRLYISARIIVLIQLNRTENYEAVQQEAAQLLQESIKLEDDNQKNQIEIYDLLGQTATNESNNDQAIAYYKQALQVALARNDTVKEIRAYLHLGIVHFLKSDYEEAARYYKRYEVYYLNKEDGSMSWCLPKKTPLVTT